MVIFRRSMPYFLGEVFCECGGTLVLSGELSMDIKKIHGTWNKRFANLPICSPLLDGGSMKVFLEVRSNELLLIFGG